MAELADLMRSVADGGLPTTDRDLTVVTPPDERSVGVLAFAGHNVVSTDLAEDWIRNWLPADDLSAPTQPPFLTVLAAATGRVLDNLDMVLVAPATGRPNGMELTELDEFIEPLQPRLARALGQRVGVRAWHCPGGLLTMGRGVAGRWEVSIEVDAALRGFGLGRGLFTAARGLLPIGGHVWAQVAPGNAASVRAALAAGFRPVGAEVLLHPGQVTFGPFTWFEAEPFEAEPFEAEPFDAESFEAEPAAEPSAVDVPVQQAEPASKVDELDELDGRDDPDELGERRRADGIVDPEVEQPGDRPRPDGQSKEPLSVSDNVTVENKQADSD